MHIILDKLSNRTITVISLFFIFMFIFSFFGMFMFVLPINHFWLLFMISGFGGWLLTIVLLAYLGRI